MVKILGNKVEEMIVPEGMGIIHNNLTERIREHF